MSRESDEQEARISSATIEAYLHELGHPEAEVVSLSPLGREEQVGLKDYGYGRPLRVTWTEGEARHDLVLRTMAPDPFGHDRRADRVASMVLSHDTFGDIPRHIRPYDVGGFDPEGRMVSFPTGEPFLVTEFVEGTLYAEELHALADAAEATPEALRRAEILARYLAELHGEPRDPAAYARCLRDTVGSSEGIFGLCDSYPEDHPVATPERLQALEQRASSWRWRLRGRSDRCARTHGDFHPFNLLFRPLSGHADANSENTQSLSVLDCSRGGLGEPADDVTCLSVNYLFFALTGRGAFEGPMRALWDRFWTVYLDATGDAALLECVAPFFTWRALVLASPVWYPHVDDAVRDTLLRFVEALLDGERFDPGMVPV